MNGEVMMNLLKKLWPINRSITGAGLRETIGILKELLPDLQIHEVKSGTKVLDWTVPEEWEIKQAYLKDPEGKIIADFSQNNLHVVGYSMGINETLTLEELLSHLYTLPDQPEVIPYVTSYYKKNWGFCMPHKQKQALKPGLYKAYIDAKHFQGSLTYGELLIPGKSHKEVLISTYCCHPSMANNELSGPVVAVALAKWLLGKKNLNYSYRFVFAPETIGAAAVLEANVAHFKKKVFSAFNLTCVGDERTWSFMPSRIGNTYADKVAMHALTYYAPAFTAYHWRQRGSDERMYCAPLINLPMVSVMRSKYGTYPEYHTSADTIGKVVTAQGLQESLVMHQHILHIIEHDCMPTSLIYGEPQLGKRGLYPSLSIKGSSAQARNLLDLISYADGNHSLLEIANLCEVPFEKIYSDFKTLCEHHIISASPLSLEV